MMLAWAMIGVGLATSAALTAWVIRTPDGGKQWLRLALAGSILAALIIGLGVARQPSRTAVAQLEAYRARNVGGAETALSCANAPEVGPLLQRVSGGKISIGQAGELRVSRLEWNQLPRRHQDQFLRTVAQTNACLRGNTKAHEVLVVDAGSGERISSSVPNP